MEFGNKKMENTEALDQSRESVEQAEQIDKDTLEGKLSTEQFDDDGDETSDANNPNDEESTDMKVRDTTAPEAAAGKFSEQVEQPEEVTSQGAKDAENAQELSSKEAIETGEAQFDDSDEMDSPDVTEENDSTEIVEKAEEPFDDTADPDTETTDTKATNSDTDGTSDIPEEAFDDSVQTENGSGDVAEQDNVGSGSEDYSTKEAETFDDSVEAAPSEDSADTKEYKADPEQPADEVKEEPFDDSKEAERSTDSADSVEKEKTTSDTNPDGTPKRFEDYSYSELSDMARDNPAKAAELNADFRERYEAEMRGMTQEEYQDYKYRLQAAQSEEELDLEGEDKEEPLSQSEKFEDIQNRVEQFRADFDADDTTISEDKKALGSNFNTMHDINELRNDIVAQKDSCMEQMGELKKENPYYNADNNADYKAVVDKYNSLDSMEHKLNAWEAELDGKNYALCEKRDLPYYQQTEHYHNSSEQKLDKMDAYLNGSDGKGGINDRLESGSTTPLDKFQFELQYDRMSSSLDDIKQHGTPEEKEKAEKLSGNLQDIKSQFEQLHTGYEMKRDGTVVEKSETHTNAKTLYSSGEQTKELANGGTRTSSVDIGIGGKHTAVEREQYLYTGENTGKSSKTVVHDGFHIRAESEEKGVKRDGTEYEKKTSSEISALRVEAGHDIDVGKGKFSTHADAALVKGHTETEVQKGDVKTSWSAEVNAGHVSGEATADINKGKYKTEITASAADTELSYEKESDGKSIKGSVSGSVLSASAEAGFDKHGLNAEVSSNNISANIDVKRAIEYPDGTNDLQHALINKHNPKTIDAPTPAQEKFSVDGLSQSEVQRINDEATEVGTAHTWSEFKADVRNQEKYTSLPEAKDAYCRVVIEQSPWADGEQPEYRELPAGTRFQMAMSKEQPDHRPGGFGTLDHIKDSEFVRENLAVKTDWKPDIDRVNTYEVVRPLPVNYGDVGPQVDVPADRYLYGGANQIEMKVPPHERMKYIVLVDSRKVD